MKNVFLEKELSYKLVGIFIEISKENGCLFKEAVYYNLLKDKFKKTNLKFIQHPKITLKIKLLLKLKLIVKYWNPI